MKIRNGFVSNSSSSSFIIGAAKIKNLDSLRKFIHINKINGVEIKKLHKTKNNNKIIIEVFDFSYGIQLDINQDAYYLLYEYAGGEGDSSFYNKYGEIDYNITEDFFVDIDAKLMLDLFMNDKNNMLDDKDKIYKYGATRDN